MAVHRIKLFSFCLACLGHASRWQDQLEQRTSLSHAARNWKKKAYSARAPHSPAKALAALFRAVELASAFSPSGAGSRMASSAGVLNSIRSMQHRRASSRMVDMESYGNEAQFLLGENVGPVDGDTFEQFLEDKTVKDLMWFDYQPGTGDLEVKPGDVVLLKFRGRALKNGQEFGAGEQVIEVGAEEAMPGFEAGVSGMREGGKRKILIPFRLGFQDATVVQSGAVPPYSDLLITCQCLKICKNPLDIIFVKSKQNLPIVVSLVLLYLIVTNFGTINQLLVGSQINKGPERDFGLFNAAR